MEFYTQQRRDAQGIQHANYSMVNFHFHSASGHLTDMLRNVAKCSMKCLIFLCEAMVVLSLYKKTHIGYTQYVDNDVYVDDVDDDETGAGAYLFFDQTQRCSHQLLTGAMFTKFLYC